GAGKNGFTRGNPQTGTPATDLDDDYFDMLQEELCSVVEASGAHYRAQQCFMSVVLIDNADGSTMLDKRYFVTNTNQLSIQDDLF
ncbi:hypothetical protein MJM28_30400, partial [Salmonella enterica subsp. enterica serovar Montevideo]|nr:hypothetical protein [Salmonella enterica subsp. enterica serovar Montevideo]